MPFTRTALPPLLLKIEFVAALALELDLRSLLKSPRGFLSRSGLRLRLSLWGCLRRRRGILDKFLILILKLLGSRTGSKILLELLLLLAPFELIERRVIVVRIAFIDLLLNAANDASLLVPIALAS